jgi:alkylation response protein AidB-like acyl-CoA dehydrogenase
MVASAYLDELTPIIKDVVEQAAIDIDARGQFPRAAVEALGKTGLLGLVSANEVGGRGEGPRAAAQVVEALARSCGSTAMVVCMHYAATAVIEACGPINIREAIAAGQHLTTLAFSEAGSRSHFWAPVSTAQANGNGRVRLNARKSWITAAGEADSYVWSSRPLDAEGVSTLWLVPARSSGLQVTAAFDGLGLRGNASSPVLGRDVEVPRSVILGEDGKGDGLMLGVILPYFQVMSAAVSLGLMEASIEKAVDHVTRIRLEHVGDRLADLPTIRAYIARMRIMADQARGLLEDTLTAMESQRPDATLRVLEVKTAAGEAVGAVTDLAMRVCGGAAFRKEAGVERYFRDARAVNVMAPTSDMLYEFVGRLTCGMPLFD